MNNFTMTDWLHLLFRRRYLIVGGTMFFGLLLLLALLLIPRQVPATATLILLEQTYNITFEEQFLSGDPLTGSLQHSQTNAIAGMADTPYVLQAVLDNIIPPLPDNLNNVKALQRLTDVNLTNNNSLIRLTVNDTDPERSVRIANTWAAFIETHINDLYNTGNIDLSHLETQLAASLEERQAAEQQLIDFRRTDDRAPLNTRLETIRSQYNQISRRSLDLDTLEIALRTFQTRLNDRPASAPATLADELIVLTLQVRVFTELNTPSQIVELQTQNLSGDNGRTYGMLSNHLDSLLMAIQQQQDMLTTTLDVLADEQEDVQVELDRKNIDFHYIKEERDLTLSTYSLLENKLVEAQIETGVPADIIRVATPASPNPSEPGIPRRLIALAGGLTILGVMIAVAILLEYWQQVIQPELDNRRA